LKLFGAGVSRNDAGSSDLSPATETVSKEHYMGQARGAGPKSIGCFLSAAALQTSASQPRDLRALVLITSSRSSINSAASF
jgi:hypothetical protein